MCNMMLLMAAGDDFRELALSFQAKTHDVALKILKLLAIGLGWDPAKFDEVGCSTCMLSH